MSKYRPNHEDFGRFMLSDQIQSPTNKVAELIKADAITNTPEDTGHTKGSYEVNEIVVSISPGGPRAAAEVRNDSPAAAPLEFGGRGSAGPKVPVRPLGRAAAKYGDTKAGE